MEVLQPTIICIGNRRYRKYPIGSPGEVKVAHDELPEDYSEYMDDDDDIDDNIIVATETGFETSLDVASEYFKYIIGKKGDTRNRIEMDTRTQIRIPRRGQEGKIVIVGRDKKGVNSARTRVELLVISARQKQPFTHFLSIPITDENIQVKIDDFKTDVLRECFGDRGHDQSIFQNPLKLHLTIGTLVLLNDLEIESAVKLLHQCHEDIIKPLLQDQPIRCHFVGLEYMNDDPGAVDVLYIKVTFPDDNDVLEIICNQLAEKFMSAGLMQKDYDRVKLHATVMNTLFRKEPSGVVRASEQYQSQVRNTSRSEGSQRNAPRESFDARQILRKFGNYDFGLYNVKELHLSQRYSTGSNGYYSATEILNLC